MAANLTEMWRINRVFGGLSALTRHLYPRLLTASGPLTLLDLGTGAADIPAYIARWARHRQIDLHIVGIDASTRILEVARARAGPLPEVSLLQADARHLPLAPARVDYVISSLLLHHLTPPQAIDLLRRTFEHTRRGLIMTDLVRGWLPLAAFKLITPLFARSFLTRHDGALSIRRAYTPAELRGLAADAGLQGARVHTHFPWRMTLVVDK